MPNSHMLDFAKQLRRNMTKEERHLWYDFLRDYPIHFYRQRILDNYIADFYCPQAKLVIELDGSQHYEPESKLKDAVRTEKIARLGITVVRFPNNLLFSRFREVCEYIDLLVCGEMPPLTEE